MRVLVTGGAGFIGSHTVDALIAAGHAVTVVDNFSTGMQVNVNGDADLEQADIRDAAVLDSIMHRTKPDVVMAIAGHVDVRHSIEDPAQDAATNVLGSLNTFWAGARNGAARLVFASTGGALYGETRTPADEHTPVQPISPYGIAKHAAEQYLVWVCHQFGIVHTTLRYANVYGPRQNTSQESGVITLFFRRMLDGDPLVIHGDGSQTRDFVYVEDVVRANLLAMTSPEGVYNIGTGVSTTVSDLAASCIALSRSSVPVEHTEAVAGEVHDSVLNAGLAAFQLGWKPRWTLADGMHETWQWFMDWMGNKKHV